MCLRMTYVRVKLSENVIHALTDASTDDEGALLMRDRQHLQPITHALILKERNTCKKR